MSLNACPSELLIAIISFVHPDHYLSLALVCKRFFCVTEEFLKKRHRFKHILIGSVACYEDTQTRSATIASSIKTSGATYKTPLDLIQDIALEQTEVAEFSARSLTLIESQLDLSLHPPLPHQDLVSDFIYKVLERYSYWKCEPELFNTINWHDQIMRCNYDAALALLLLVFPNLQYICLDRRRMPTDYVDSLARIAASNRSLHIPRSLCHLREVRHASSSWDIEALCSWVSLPAAKEVFATQLQASVNRSHIWDHLESGLTRLTITHAHLRAVDFYWLLRGLHQLKYLSYHPSIDFLVNRQWDCSKFFSEIRRNLRNTLEYLDFGLGTETLDPYFRGWCCPLVDLTRLKDLTIDCNMLYRGPSGSGQRYLASALLESKARRNSNDDSPLRRRVLPSSIEKLTIRDQRSQHQSVREYVEAHRAFSSDIFAGDPAEIRQTYPHLSVIYNVVDIEEGLKTSLENIGIEFRNRSYFWETETEYHPVPNEVDQPLTEL